MVQGFYSLDEAARVLGMAQEELSQMAQRREIRAFADRGTWRFRTQDVEELARRLGKGSSPDLQLGEAGRPKPHDSPAPKGKGADPEDSSVFTFSLGRDEEEVPLGLESPSSKNLGRGPRSPKPGSDSDVRLVSEGSDVDFRVAGDSGSSKSGKRKPGSDSSVKLVESKSDSDVKIVPDATSEDSSVPIGMQPPRKGSDSDIRLEQQIPPAGGKGRGSHSGDESLLTEEIDLDEEIRAAEAATKKGKGKTKPQSPAPKMGAVSPFELSDSDLEEPRGKTKKKAPTPESSSELEFSPADSSPISLSSDEVPAMPDSSSDDVVDLGTPSSKPVRGGPDSGINLDAPADSGISLEQSGDGSDEIEFELSLDASSTPKPAPAAQEDDSSSEFELTLDDSGGLAPLEDDGLKPSDSGEKDIFETDFEVPALDDESGSQAVALDESDTDLESSDFDLALGDEDSGTDEESGSQVVVLDEDEADEGAATVARSTRRVSKAAALDSDSDDSADVMTEEEPMADEEEEITRRPAAAASADWGLLPALVMGPCAVVMLLVGIMGFELLHSMWGYRQPGRVSGPIVRNLSELFGAELPKD